MAGAGVEYTPDDIGPQTEVERVKDRNEQRLLALTDVIGVGIGRNALGDDAILVYVKHADAAKTVPKTIDGLDLMVEVVGEISIQK